MFNNKWIVIGLALFAGYFFYSRVVVTIMGAEGDAPVLQVVDDDPDLFLIETNEAGSGIETVEQGFKFSSAQRDLQRINVAEISWNTNPTRDPFAPPASLNADAIETVQAEVDVAKLQPVTRLRARVRSWPRINAVVSSANHRYAVIDGEIRRIGERFDRYELIAVNNGGVRLMDLTDFRSQEVMVTP